MIKGNYKIEDYTVTIDGVDETRQKVIYYNIDGEEITAFRFNGNYDEIDSDYLSFNGCPIKVTRWQFKAQLECVPNPIPAFDVQYMIDQMIGNEKIIAQSAWDNANFINRYSPLVLSMAQSLGLNDSDIDQIFIQAYNINI
jgi:hypothetical protein